ncbi:hypothetical protein F511_11949 [Dorcoceras hygrometricum]|uniref:Uncharacterized protein n=1 Tax=Dorcoceras hygrometricum TaxID=472368 RepID=A0A2Z7BSK5_9LAMI|nr:hypothetical protein F511_11949 [Dorcoceras hygrometricum]
MLYLTCAACLDWSRREDIQVRIVKGRLSWTGRRYQAGTEQTKNQLVKDKPVGHNIQEQIVREDLSSEDDEDQLERRSTDKSKLEELLKSGCKQEDKERALNRLRRQPAQTRPARCKSD